MLLDIKIYKPPLSFPDRNNTTSWSYFDEHTIICYDTFHKTKLMRRFLFLFFRTLEGNLLNFLILYHRNKYNLKLNICRTQISRLNGAL